MTLRTLFGPKTFTILFGGSQAMHQKVLASVCLSLAVLCATPPQWAQSDAASTAWKEGTFHVDRKAIIGRSDIILRRSNPKPQEAMPLGNGRLGIGVWAEDGYTAQLNRGDTLPLRLSPGQLVIPSLARLSHASDYSGRLDLYNGEFRATGAGITAITYVDQSLDVLVVDVSGADPNTAQSAELRLWAPRQPQASAHAAIATLAETWLDNKEAGASGKTFGSLAGLTADAVDVKAETVSPISVRITFRPHPDGTFRILVGSPAWHGGAAAAAASGLLAKARALPIGEHRAWWNHFWQHPGLMKLSSSDHAAEYLENLRMIDLFTAAAESQDRIPGSQAGIGDLFSSIRDEHRWGPSAYWHWNLRMQIGANLGAGVPELNSSYFNLYRDNLKNEIAWTKLHFGSAQIGMCVPETLRFNGQGYENETWLPAPGVNCAKDYKPYYNARTLSTGAEVSLWMWQQYLFTNDQQFLSANYPFMRESTLFLLNYATHDAQGLLHTFPSNAHETQWDVHDPTTDVSAMRALFPAVVQATTILHTDPDLIARLKKEIPILPQFPIVTQASPHDLVADAASRPDTIIAASHDPGAAIHNTENIGLEPVWPYGLIGDDGPLHAIAVRTFLSRPNKNEDDWSLDPTQAARLGLAEEFKSSALALTERYQLYPNGLAAFMGPEFYVEQDGVLADAMQNALAQDYDGLLRIAPAWPKDWSADATVYLTHGSKVDLQIRNGRILTVGIEAGVSEKMRVRNPWPNQQVEVIDASTSAVVPVTESAHELSFSVTSRRAYLIRTKGSAAATLQFQVVTGVPATAPRSFGSRTIGIP
jgi:alpha-L-fucosidase 2